MKIPESLCKDTVLKYISEFDIFERYLNHKIEIKEYYLSPFREEEDPSFNIYINRFNGRPWFKDHAKHSGDCFRLVELLYQCTFMEALQLINEDFNLGIGSTDITFVKREIEERKVKKVEFKIDIKVQPYTEADKEYWEQYDIPINFLKYFNIYSCQYTWINGIRIFDWDYKNNNPVYAYYYDKKLKLYRPYGENKRNKWKSNLLPEQWLGLKQLPEKGENLIISKGYKDVVVLRRMGIAGIATSGESHTFPPAIISNLKERFKNIFVWFDNDQTGIEYGKLRAEENNISYVHNPIGEPKDTSDFVKEYGIEAGKDLLYNLNILK